MAPIFAPTPRPTPLHCVSGQPDVACARTHAAPVVVTTPPVALAATDPAGRLVVVVGQLRPTTTAWAPSRRCVVAAVLVLGRSSRAPERQDTGRPAVAASRATPAETDKVRLMASTDAPPTAARV